MQASECIYVSGMSLTVGMQAGAATAVGLSERRHGIPVVILSSDAPEWAMIALKPPCSRQNATAEWIGALAS